MKWWKRKAEEKQPLRSTSDLPPAAESVIRLNFHSRWEEAKTLEEVLEIREEAVALLQQIQCPIPGYDPVLAEAIKRVSL